MRTTSQVFLALFLVATVAGAEVSRSGPVLPVGTCGDGILDPGEQCDDGNNMNGDACRPFCRSALGVPAAFDSDDFNACSLDAGWTLVDPLDVSTTMLSGAGTGDALFTFHLPAGTAHDAWAAAGNQAVRIMRPAANALDLEIEVKFETAPTGGFHDQGVIVEQDAQNWMRFDVFHTGTALRAFIGSTVNGTNTALLNVPLPANSAKRLVVVRDGNTWAFWYSPDGQSWSMAGLVSRSLVVTSVGVFAANPVSGSEVHVLVDYFFNLAAPAVPEDGPLADCDDGDLCTDETCDYDAGTCTSTANFDPATECCDPATGVTVDANDLDSDGETDCAGDCFDSDPTLNNRDDDGDGASTCDGDCDDNDPAQNTDDADGDGASTCEGDCNDGDPAQNTLDGDGDGTSTCTGDCDDSDRELNPYDEDGDGASTCDGDCDDKNPLAAPGLAEQCDLVDNDCDGTIDEGCICGDGIVGPGETCDDGNTDDGDACTAACEPAVCGDGIVRVGVEECDDDKESATCDADCTLAACGDGTLNARAGEQCDDGNTGDGDGCSSLCTLDPTCGNGAIEPGEQCDDGNTDDGDGCASQCTLELGQACGNGLIEPGERCDDGNDDELDGCRTDCTLTNFVVNGSFVETRRPWVFTTDGDGKFTIPGQKARIDILVEGLNVQLYQPLVLEPGMRYRLRFLARNSTGRNMRVGFVNAAKPGVNYGLNQFVPLGTRWKPFEYVFETPMVPLDPGRLRFVFGPYDVAGTIYFLDEVVLEKLSATCGDGVVDAAEACDDAGESAACNADCSYAVCGDGEINATAGETCDDGNVLDGDGCSSNCGAPSSVIVNGDFEAGLAPWDTFTNGVAKFQVREGVARVELTVPGTNTQLMQRPLALDGDTLYVLAFDARSSNGRNVEVQVISDSLAGVSYGLKQAVDLTTEMKRFTLYFTTPPGYKTEGRLTFRLDRFGQPGNVFWFDNVVLEKAKLAAAPPAGAR